MPADIKEGLLQHLISRKILARPIWVINNTHPMYQESLSMNLTVANKIQKEGINLPSSVDLTDAQISYVCNEIRDFFS